MKKTAKASNDGGISSNKAKGRKKNKPSNEPVTYEPQFHLDEFLDLRQDKIVFTVFVKHFLKPAYSTKWKRKRQEENATKIADILTASDEAYVLLNLENNWKRWIDINNKANNDFKSSTRGMVGIDSNVMPKYTYINKKRTDLAGKNRAPEAWRGWNNDGINRFTELCKKVKVNRAKYMEKEKTILSDMALEEEAQRPKKRKKKMPPVAKAYVESDTDGSNGEIEEDNESDESSEDEIEE